MSAPGLTPSRGWGRTGDMLSQNGQRISADGTTGWEAARNLLTAGIWRAFGSCYGVNLAGPMPGWFWFVGGVCDIREERRGFPPPRRQQVRWVTRLVHGHLYLRGTGTPRSTRVARARAWLVVCLNSVSTRIAAPPISPRGAFWVSPAGMRGSIWGVPSCP